MQFDASRNVAQKLERADYDVIAPPLENNQLSFENAAMAADVAKAREVYRACDRTRFEITEVASGELAGVPIPVAYQSRW
jgi:hypothetical protein